MSPRHTTPVTTRHGEAYTRRTEPWTTDAAVRELTQRLQDRTGLARERCVEIAEAHRSRFWVNSDGQLRIKTSDGNFEPRASDPFAFLVGRIANLIDTEGKLPKPKTPEEMQASLREHVPYGNP